MAGANQVNRLRDSSQPLSTRQQDNVTTLANQTGAAVSKTPIGGAKPPAWQRANYFSGSPAVATAFLDIAPSSVAGAPASQTLFHRDALGYVWVHVAAVSAAGAGAGAAVLTLPTAYRPAQDCTVAAQNKTSGAANFLTVSPAGVVATVPAVGVGASVVGYFSFLAEQ